METIEVMECQFRQDSGSDYGISLNLGPWRKVTKTALERFWHDLSAKRTDNLGQDSALNPVLTFPTESVEVGCTLDGESVMLRMPRSVAYRVLIDLAGRLGLEKPVTCD